VKFTLKRKINEITDSDGLDMLIGDGKVTVAPKPSPKTLEPSSTTPTTDKETSSKPIDTLFGLTLTSLRKDLKLDVKGLLELFGAELKEVLREVVHEEMSDVLENFKADQLPANYWKVSFSC